MGKLDTAAELQSLSISVADILGDLQKLLSQEAALAKSELVEEMAKAKGACFCLGLTAITATVALMTFALMLVQLLQNAGLPPWAAYGITALGLAALAVSGLRVASARARALQFPPRTTVRNIQEDLRCLATHS